MVDETFSILDDLTKNQKFTVIVVLRIFNSGNEDTNIQKKRDRVISHIENDLKLKHDEVETYINNSAPEVIGRELLNLREMQKEFLIALAYDVLFCIGKPSERDLMIMENVFNQIIGTDRTKFSKSLEKIHVLKNHFQ